MDAIVRRFALGGSGVSQGAQTTRVLAVVLRARGCTGDFWDRMLGSRPHFLCRGPSVRGVIFAHRPLPHTSCLWSEGSARVGGPPSCGWGDREVRAVVAIAYPLVAALSALLAFPVIAALFCLDASDGFLDGIDFTLHSARRLMGGLNRSCRRPVSNACYNEHYLSLSQQQLLQQVLFRGRAVDFHFGRA